MTGTVKEVIEHLQKYYAEDDVILADLWSVEDIEGNLTKEQAEDVLYRADDSFDANIGINWDVLWYHIQSVKEESETNEEEDDL